MPKETETVEFKENFHSKEEIGERISALSNSACLARQPFAYIVFGIENETHNIVGTRFNSKKEMVGNEELEVWLLNRLNPRVDFQCFDFIHEEKGVQHACLRYVSNETMTNQTLRNRFGIEDYNASMASRIIKEALTAGMIKEEDTENHSKKFKKYIPSWA